MTAVPHVAVTKAQDLSPELDEAFLQRVDRAVLACKQCDPYRLGQIHRALEEEIHLAGVNDAMYLDQPPRRNSAPTSTLS